MKSFVATLLATASLGYAQTATEQEPFLSAIESAAASIQPYSPVSNVEGVAFNRFFQVWLENIVCISTYQSENLCSELTSEELRGCSGRSEHEMAGLARNPAVGSHICRLLMA